MREILFTGKRVDNGEWVEGFYVFVPEHYKPEMSRKSYIVSINNGFFFEVIPETVRQYIGMTDKNGKKIFEDDIVRYEDSAVLEVAWGRLGWRNLGEGTEGDQDEVAMVHFWHKCKIVGNKWDTPELLEVKE